MSLILPPNSPPPANDNKQVAPEEMAFPPYAVVLPGPHQGTLTLQVLPGGLTKLEFMATHIMAGMGLSGAIDASPTGAAVIAVAAAKALLAELHNPTPIDPDQLSLGNLPRPQ